jgi:hyperosmotically inducible protein
MNRDRVKLDPPAILAELPPSPIFPRDLMCAEDTFFKLAASNHVKQKHRARFKSGSIRLTVNTDERIKPMKAFKGAMAGVFSAVLIVAGFISMPSTARAGASTTSISPDVSAIENQVHRKLISLPWYGVFDNLQYQVNGTEVVLSGQVVSEHDRTKTDAESLVRRIPGVTKVENKIEVLPVSGFDNRIRRDAFRTIFSRSDLGRYTMGPIPQVHIIVRNGNLTLEGAVINQMDKTIAGMAANSVSGVFSVTNNLHVD